MSDTEKPCEHAYLLNNPFATEVPPGKPCARCGTPYDPKARR